MHSELECHSAAPPWVGYDPREEGRLPILGSVEPLQSFGRSKHQCCRRIRIRMFLYFSSGTWFLQVW